MSRSKCLELFGLCVVSLEGFLTHITGLAWDGSIKRIEIELLFVCPTLPAHCHSFTHTSVLELWHCHSYIPLQFGNA